MITAVFDCMVFLQAVTNDRSPAWACLELVESGNVRIFLSQAVLGEVADVLRRPKIRAKFSRLTDKQVDRFLQKLVTLAEVVVDVPDAGLMLRDPNDLPYLNLAIAAHAQYIVTRDRDLLDLANDQEFRRRHPDLQIVDPVAFLQTPR